MSASLATVSYIGATILFILSLGGLSNPETVAARQPVRHDRHGDRRAGDRVRPAREPRRPGVDRRRDGDRRARSACTLARTVKMTQMPELVAFMHSLVGLAAMLVGYASFIDPSASAGMSPAESVDPRHGDLCRRADRRGDPVRAR